ncbi:hypothetical protein [Microbacterium sediminis]|uniref:DUF7882 domain-containing protein n=1 Tax=Microbacterium sediminis TaxID=904291 RepID=A0A1B9NC79_9MICO|nr:hypothetical protein [Microbacterium sediminis]OCG74200.1 hypothetical protein A7J15_04905 [Microbacterium sediminis]
MGLFIYDNADPPIRIDDRTLWHLRAVILTKLRRNETFSVSWAHPEGDEAGYTTIWLHPSIPLRFLFDSSERPELNRDWLARLTVSAVEHGGIELTQEEVHETTTEESAPSAVLGHRDAEPAAAHGGRSRGRTGRPLSRGRTPIAGRGRRR